MTCSTSIYRSRDFLLLFFSLNYSVGISVTNEDKRTPVFSQTGMNMSLAAAEGLVAGGIVKQRILEIERRLALERLDTSFTEGTATSQRKKKTEPTAERAEDDNPITTDADCLTLNTDTVKSIIDTVDSATCEEKRKYHHKQKQALQKEQGRESAIENARPELSLPAREHVDKAAMASRMSHDNVMQLQAVYSSEHDLRSRSYPPNEIFSPYIYNLFNY
jgi:hypothetical protein